MFHFKGAFYEPVSWPKGFSFANPSKDDGSKRERGKKKGGGGGGRGGRALGGFSLGFSFVLFYYRWSH